MQQEWIEIKGARVNNLKDVDVKIPKGKLTVFTGVSGSGKSSIVFDTIAEEAGRQLNETFTAYSRQFLPKYSRPEVDEINNLGTAIIVDQKRLGGNSRSTLGTISDIHPLLRVLFSRFATPTAGMGNAYSFNDPEGMCETCEGIGETMTLNLEAALDVTKSLNDGAILVPGHKVGNWQWKMYADTGFFDNDLPIKDYTPEAYDLLVHCGEKKIKGTYNGSEFNMTYEGLAPRFMRQQVGRDKDMSEKAQKELETFIHIGCCPNCKGSRYNGNVLASKINGYSIHDLCNLQLVDLLPVIKTIQLPEAAPILDGIRERVQNLVDIGLGYMNLNRSTPTLSGGESQRVKMVKYLSSTLTGMMYIFDEPSTGLHPRDVYKLNNLLASIRDKGNTVIVVEHDPDVIKTADYIIDVGPKAGSGGGNIMYAGDYAGLLESGTLTGEHLRQKLPFNPNPRESSSFLESHASSIHNLKNASLKVPQGIFTVVTGVAGSGKSTLVNKVFKKDFPEAVQIDQSAVSANSRSNPATYSEMMTPIRKLFATANGVDNSLFSYNSKGACEHCKGKGAIQLNLSFMDATEVECSSCQGKRFKDEVLHYEYLGKNIVDIMDMTISDALEFFADSKDIQKKLKSLQTVGLGYLTLGQPLNTLSGGECQRLKIAKELNKKGNIYILDEPTTGLHMADVSNILGIISMLVKKGNTVLVIEHNTDVIRQADYLIDLGPDGGDKGGHIVFEGKPEDLLACGPSLTAKYL
ncbi:MAG: excinuclease ABC subunit UvrA [Turicibacter sp.]|nr:excinuclease ABC subunit UvrA [Turicibacter sp.]